MTFYIDNMAVEGLLEHNTYRSVVTTVTVSAGTLNLTNLSSMLQYLKGNSTGQVVKLPDCTTLPNIGWRFEIWNSSSTIVAVQNNAGTVLFSLNPDQRALVVCVDNSTASGEWKWSISDKYASGMTQFTATYPGTGLAVNYTSGNVDFDGVRTQVPAGTITLPANTTAGWMYVDLDAVVKATAAMPVGAVPLYRFTTSGTAVTVMEDFRQDLMEDLVWGVTGEISSITSSDIKSSGVLNKYARADHKHGTAALKNKSGVVAAATFTGNPRTAVVTFASPLASATYAVSISGADARTWTYSNRTVNGFTINANAGTALTGDVSWHAIVTGEAT